MGAYITVVPRKFVLESGEIITLTAEEVVEKLTKNTMFKLWVPDIEKIHEHLIEKQHFEYATPSIPKGEKYNLRKKLNNVWELHLRLYKGGFIEAEVEVRREFIEHLTQKRLNVVYEPFEFYREAYDGFHLLYTPRNEWIIKIIDHFYVKLREPDTLTPWKPIVLGIVAVGLFAYALLRLSKGGDRSE